MWSFKQELGRKAVHAFWFVVLIVYIYLENKTGANAMYWLLGWLFLFLILDYFRLEKNFKIPFFHKLIRKEQEKNLLTATYVMIGMVISFAVFSKQIATAAVAMMIFGDIAANLVGRLGKIRFWNGKSLEGSTACFVVSIFVGLIVVKLWYLAIIMALAATLIEAVSTKIDDNMLMPLFAGLVGHIISSYI